MAIFEWNDRCLVGVAHLDEQHKYLVDLLNQAYDYSTDGVHKKVDLMIDCLVDYAAFHFAAEEIFLKRHSYPKLAEQTEQHEWFTRKILSMMEDGSNDKPVQLNNILDFLKHWLQTHILKSDAEFGRYLATKVTSH